MLRSNPCHPPSRFARQPGENNNKKTILIMTIIIILIIMIFSTSAPFDYYQLFFTILDQVVLMMNSPLTLLRWWWLASLTMMMITDQDKRQFIAARVKNSKVSTQSSTFYLFFADGAQASELFLLLFLRARAPRQSGIRTGIINLTPRIV